MTILKENNSIRKLLNVTQWHEKNITGENTTVIILDSSKGKSLPFMNLYYTDVFGNAIESGHPINVAQTLHEISPSTKILYFDNTRNKDAVFEWIKAHQNEIDIINVSLAGLNGMPTDDYLRYEALSPIMVCASGNDYYTDHISYPAQYPFTIAIGATNRVGTSVDSYSNKGSMIIATCPSHTYIRNSEGMIWSPSGTSFASPVAVGLLAIYIDWRKKNRLSKLTPEEAMQFVKNNCVDIEEVGKDYASGYGLFCLPKQIPIIKIIKPKEPEIIIINNPPLITNQEQPKNNNGDGKMSYKIALNAGHGIKNNGTIDVGAIGQSGYQEYIETKEITNLVSTKLKFNGIETLVIQDGDLWDVTNSSNTWKSDYFISIHCNSFSPNSHGVETFSLASVGKGRMLAESVHKELIPTTGLYNRGLKSENYHVLRETDCPAILTEIGFISNPKEEALMKDSVWDDKVSSAIARGICNFLGIAFKEQNNNQGVNDMLDVCVLLYSKEDYWSGTDVAEKNGNCAIFIRPADKSVHKDAMSAKKLIVIGGSKTGHKNELLLSGNDKYDTANKVHNYLLGK